MISEVSARLRQCSAGHVFHFTKEEEHTNCFVAKEEVKEEEVVVNKSKRGRPKSK